MGLWSIGEFAAATRLSPKALRLYDELGLLPPARVDPDSGYRWYAEDQVERARLVAMLRRIGLSLREVKQILPLDPHRAAEQVAAHWAQAEADHAARRELAGFLVDRLNGKRTIMHEVAIRDMPPRSLMCLNRHVGPEEVRGMGKEFTAKFRNALLPGGTPRIDGIAGAPFVIWYGEVSQDSDGPIEWCRPVPDEQAEEIAAALPELTLRTEPAHQEAYIHLESVRELPEATIVMESLTAWANQHQRQPAGAIRQILIGKSHPDADRPGCEYAVPLR
jgi:DNA-binding transcriptional MerR regulator